MTEQIYAALAFILGTPDIAVQQVCEHHCIRSRGAMDPHSLMTTSKLGGKFKDNPALRQEFLHGIR
jgi:GTP cyclohydrolase IA